MGTSAALFGPWEVDVYYSSRMVLCDVTIQNEAPCDVSSSQAQKEASRLRGGTLLSMVGKFLWRCSEKKTYKIKVVAGMTTRHRRPAGEGQGWPLNHFLLPLNEAIDHRPPLTVVFHFPHSKKMTTASKRVPR